MCASFTRKEEREGEESLCVTKGIKKSSDDVSCTLLTAWCELQLHLHAHPCSSGHWEVQWTLRVEGPAGLLNREESVRKREGERKAQRHFGHLQSIVYVTFSSILPSLPSVPSCPWERKDLSNELVPQ